MKLKRPPWFCNNHPLFSLALDCPVSRALVLGLLPCPAHCRSHRYLQLTVKLCSETPVQMSLAAECFSSVPRAAPGARVGWAQCLQCGCRAIPCWECSPEPLGTISAAVPLQPWQQCKVAGAAVFKHCICRQLHSMKSLSGTHIAGAEKRGV